MAGKKTSDRSKFGAQLDRLTRDHRPHRAKAYFEDDQDSYPREEHPQYLDRRGLTDLGVYL